MDGSARAVNHSKHMLVRSWPVDFMGFDPRSMMEAIDPILLNIVLGITEFLPISSLGHSIVLAALLNFPPTKEARDTRAVFIQGGAILAVIVYFGVGKSCETIPITSANLSMNHRYLDYWFCPQVISASRSAARRWHALETSGYGWQAASRDRFPLEHHWRQPGHFGRR